MSKNSVRFYVIKSVKLTTGSCVFPHGRNWATGHYLLRNEVPAISHETQECENSDRKSLLTNLFVDPHLFMCRWKQYELREQTLSHVNYPKCLSSRVNGMVNVVRLHVLALYTALHWRFICYFYSNWMEKIFPPSSVAMEASMLAVIHGHLFVLVCNESLKRVACPNWECLPFRHLYEPNDPGARGRLFIGFPVFYHFLKFKLSAPLERAPITFQKHYG